MVHLREPLQKNALGELPSKVWREHRAGFRSHTLLLAFVPVLVLHTVVVLALSPLLGASRVLNVAMLAVDIAVFAVLARYLRTRFLDASARR